jgi:GNAT superfamily N-acetyltransferase
MKLDIHQATRSELDAVSEILIEAAHWLEEKGEPLWADDKLIPNAIEKDVNEGLYFIAFSNDEAAGVFKLQLEDNLCWPDEEHNESIYVHRIAVKRIFAGGSISSEMMDFAKKRTSALGRNFLRLDCEASRHKLCSIYESMGFSKHSYYQVGPYHISRYQFTVAPAEQGGRDKAIVSPPVPS